MRTIEIGGVAYPFVYGYGALMLAEEILGEPWGGKLTMRSNFVLFYACLVNGDAECPLTFDTLVACCDEDTALYQRMGDELSAQLSRWGKPSGSEDDSKKND